MFKGPYRRRPTVGRAFRSYPVPPHRRVSLTFGVLFFPTKTRQLNDTFSGRPMFGGCTSTILNEVYKIKSPKIATS